MRVAFSLQPAASQSIYEAGRGCSPTTLIVAAGAPCLFALIVVVTACAPQIACTEDRNCPDELPACVDGLCGQPLDADDPRNVNEGEGEGAQSEGEGETPIGEADNVCGVRVPRGVDPDHVVGGDDDAFAGCHADVDGAFDNYVAGDGPIFIAPGTYTATRPVPDGALVVGNVAARDDVVLSGVMVVDSAEFRGVSFIDVDVSTAAAVDFDRVSFTDDALVAVAFAGALDVKASDFGAVDVDIERGAAGLHDIVVDGRFHISGFSSDHSLIERAVFTVDNDDDGLAIDADVDIDVIDCEFAGAGAGTGGLQHTGATLKVRGSTFHDFHGALLAGRPVGAVRVVDGPLSTGKSRINLGDSDDDGGNVFADNDTDLSIETPYVPFELQAVGNTWSQAPVCDEAIVRIDDDDTVMVSIGNSSFCSLPL